MKRWMILIFLFLCTNMKYQLNIDVPLTAFPKILLYTVRHVMFNVALIPLKSNSRKRSIRFIKAKAGHRQTYMGLWEWLYMVGCLVELQAWQQLVMEIGPWGYTNPWSNFNSQNCILPALIYFQKLMLVKKLGLTRVPDSLNMSPNFEFIINRLLLLLLLTSVTDITYSVCICYYILLCFFNIIYFQCFVANTAI